MDPARKSFVFKLAVVLVLVLVSAALVFLYLKYAKYNGKELLDYLKGTILQQDQPKAPMSVDTGCIENTQTQELVEHFNVNSCAARKYLISGGSLVKKTSTCGDGIAFGAYTSFVADALDYAKIVLDPEYEKIIITAIPSRKLSDIGYFPEVNYFDCNNPIPSYAKTLLCKNVTTEVDDKAVRYATRVLSFGDAKEGPKIARSSVIYSDTGLKVEVISSSSDFDASVNRVKDLNVCMANYLGVPIEEVYAQ